MVYQEEPSNSFNHFTRLASSKLRRVTFPQHYSDHIWRPEFSENELQHQPPAMTRALSHYSSIKSNQLKVHPAFCVPMFPAYQCRTTSVDQEEVKFASKIRRYQPYWLLILRMYKQDNSSWCKENNLGFSVRIRKTFNGNCQNSNYFKVLYMITQIFRDFIVLSR